LKRILQQQRKSKKAARWRIMVASDPSRPMRTFTLPRLLPTVLTTFTVALIAATVILACGSWKLSGSLGRLEHRVRAMVKAADSVALANGSNGASAGTGDGQLLMPAVTTRVVQTPGARIGKFT